MPLMLVMVRFRRYRRRWDFQCPYWLFFPLSLSSSHFARSLTRARYLIYPYASHNQLPPLVGSVPRSLHHEHRTVPSSPSAFLRLRLRAACQLTNVLL